MIIWNDVRVEGDVRAAAPPLNPDSKIRLRVNYPMEFDGLVDGAIYFAVGIAPEIATFYLLKKQCAAIKS